MCLILIIIAYLGWYVVVRPAPRGGTCMLVLELQDILFQPMYVLINIKD